MRPRSLSAAALLFLCFLVFPALAAEPRPTARDLAELKQVGEVTISPDGVLVAYTVGEATLDPEAKPTDDDTTAGWKRTRALWLVARDGGAPRRLTWGEERVSSPVWGPDGTLAFLRKREGKTRIHLLPREGGEARPVDTGTLEPGSFRFSPDGATIAFTAERPLTDEEKEARWRTGGVKRVGREWRPARLWTVPAEGGEPREVAPGGTESIADFRWSPDGTRFAILHAASSDPYETFNRAAPAILARADGSLRPLDGPGTYGPIEWSPDGRQVAYLKGVESLSMLNTLLVAAAVGSASRPASQGRDHTFLDFAWSGDGRSLLALVSDRTETRFLRLPAGGGAPEDLGRTERLVEGSFDASGDGSVLAFASSTPEEPADPSVLVVGTRALSVLARSNPPVKDWSFGRTEVVRWRNPEGIELEGIVTWPPAGAGKPGLHVYPHGGPDSVSQRGFQGNATYLAARGWAVFRPNYRGGLGYGYDFYAANRGKLGDIEFADVESGVDALIASGRVDAGRLVYGSWSWGGYLTAWTIGHTDRYRAAVAGAAVVDVISQYALSDINHGVAAEWEYKGNPWRQPEAFDRANPLRFLGNARTPTLILHGEADDRVHPSAGWILYAALRDLEVPVEFYLYPREPHGFQEPAHLVHRLETWAAWFERWAGSAKPGA